MCTVTAGGTVTAAGEESLAVFLDLPMARGFSDATQALVETKEMIRGPLASATELRLVDRSEDADVVLTVIGRGRGHDELTTALRNISATIVAPSVPIADSERYIEILLTTGSCRTLALTVEDHAQSPCFRRVFVGVGFGEPGERRPAKPRRNSWETCAEDVVRDIRAWMTENANRLRTLRTTAVAATQP
jgi:hypothetical protein